MDREAFRTLPVMGIVRAPGSINTAALAEAVLGAGLSTIEITMNTPDAPTLIKKLKQDAGPALAVGAGTVLDLPQMHQALDAGAGFIVMPIIVDAVMEYCVSHDIPVFPGAFAPQDIYRAHHMGATMVKLFPAKSLGPVYISELKGPFPDIPLIAVGGVTPANIGEFFQAGAAAVAVGGSVFRREWLERGDYASIGTALGALIGAYREMLH